jgi:hypothetical protein
MSPGKIRVYMVGKSEAKQEDLVRGERYDKNFKR